MTAQLQYGRNYGVPDVTTAWGARAILHQQGGVDIVHDRQGGDGPRKAELMAYLNEKFPWGKLQTRVDELLYKGALKPDSDELVVLFADDQVKLVGSPNASYGYLYMRAWFKEDEIDG